MDLKKEFYNIRRVSTPWCLVQTPDYRTVIELFSKEKKNVPEGEELPVVVWDMSGHKPGLINQASKDACGRLGGANDTVDAPRMALREAMKLPKHTIFFVIFTSNEVLQDPGVTQAIANLRTPFKSNHCTLVILGNLGLQPSDFIAADIPILRQELPTHDEIDGIASKLHGLVKLDYLKPERVIASCQGLTQFAVEEAIARKLTKDGLDFNGLATAQQIAIEESTNRALTFEKEKWTFDDIGGIDQFHKFMKMLFSGPKPPKLVVRLDEIDKSVNASSTGAVADNTGTSQDQLKTFLTAMEDNKWTGCLLCGGPGSGKTLSTICIGNSFECRTLVGDLGACKDSLVGASERKIRTMMNVLKSIGGEDVLFLGTANRLDTLPPEFQRRFSLGTFYFSRPNEKEREAIWKIQMKKFGLNKKGPMPDSRGWMGSDIRNCCRMAWLTNQSLKDSAEMLTIAGKSAAKDIERLEDLADRSGFLSASHPGQFRKKAESDDREISL